MKDGLKYIVGKRIAAVVYAKSDREPRLQVFLVFADGSRFEFYGDDFTCCSGLDDATKIESYVKSAGGAIVHKYDEPLERKSPPYPLSTGPTYTPYHVTAPDKLED